MCWGVVCDKVSTWTFVSESPMRTSGYKQIRNYSVKFLSNLATNPIRDVGKKQTGFFSIRTVSYSEFCIPISNNDKYNTRKPISFFSYYIVQPVTNPVASSTVLENLLPFTSYQLVIRTSNATKNYFQTDTICFATSGKTN